VRNTTETLSATSPNHAMDNSGQQDVLVLNFTDGPVALNQLQLGWWSNDSDLSVLRWTGSGAPDSGSASITNQTVSSLLTSGWAFVAALSNVGTSSPASFNTGAAAVTSSYWLISAFNSSWGAGSITDTKSHYVKVLSVGANVPTHRTNVPEPVSIALVGAALLGVMGSRRRATLRH